MSTRLSRSVLACAALFCAASAHAAISVQGQASGITLVITEASGAQSIYPGMQAQGDALWHPALTLYEAQGSDTLLSNAPLETTDGSSSLNSSLPFGQAQVNANIGGSQLTTSFSYVSPSYTSEQLALLQTATTSIELRALDVNVSAVGAISPAVLGSPELLEQGILPPTTGGFWLAPGAEARLSGTLFLSASVSADELLGQAAGPILRARVLADISAHMTLVGDGGSLFGDTLLPPEMAPFADTGYRLDWNGSIFGNRNTAPQSTNVSETFSVSVTNTSSQGLWLLTSIGSGVSGFQNFLPSPAPAIPEPGTWALMGLGLVGISAVARRHQRARV